MTAERTIACLLATVLTVGPVFAQQAPEKPQTSGPLAAAAPPSTGAPPAGGVPAAGGPPGPAGPGAVKAAVGAVTAGPLVGTALAAAVLAAIAGAGDSGTGTGTTGTTGTR